MSDSQVTIDTPLEGLQYKLLVQRLMLQAPGEVRLVAGEVTLAGVTLSRAELAQALARETHATTLTTLDHFGGEPRGMLLSGQTWVLELHFNAADDFDYDYASANDPDDDVAVPNGLLSLAVIGDPAQLLEAIGRLGIRSSLTHKTEETVSVTFAFQGPRGPTYREGIFDKLPLATVRNNYSPAVVSGAEHLLGLMRDKTHGLVFLGGPTGTGKSYLIRTILSELRTSRKGLVCSPALDFLRNPGILLQVASQYKRAIVVLEDVGEVLEHAAQGNGRVEEVSGLLNLSEGLLSILSDTVMVVSSNVPPDKLNPALLRPGRCLGRLEVGKLDHEQAQRWSGRDLPKRAYTLAELYALRDGVAPILEPAQERTGFRTSQLP